MGIILSNSFIDVADADITARSEATGYPKINVMDRWNLKRRFRAGDAAVSNYLLKFDFGAAQTLRGIFLNDINFSKIKVLGNESDAWEAPSYESGELTVGQNPITGRYQVYIPLDTFEYQWLILMIPSDAAAVGDYTSAWEIGTVCFLSAVTELECNMSYDYGQTGRHFYKTTVNERIQTAGEIRWEGSIVFGNRSTDNETEMWTLNRMNMASPFVYFENSGDTSKAYLCVRDDSIETKLFTFGGISGNTIKIKEAYMLGEN